jgi:hypothetical protein
MATLLLFSAIVPASAQSDACTCDCNADGIVTVAEIVQALNVALGAAPSAACIAADADRDGSVGVGELIAGVNAALGGCAPSITPTVTPAPTSTPTPPEDQMPPTNPTELLAWLETGRYLAWASESGAHPSGGPHFGQVRTYVNDALFQSLAAGSSSHPAGAAAVKELYGSGGPVRGWSVSHKVQPDSADGDGWYWYERFRGTVYGEGIGNPICTGCHGSDFGSFRSKDFVLAPFPLQ